uniref:Uncharacterized protein n=1 Tax=Populus davidiana TaxID=266767 RepID=A0A6M2EE99_9ROSI
MSLLNQLFNRGVFGSKCKTCLNLAISRIKLLQNKRDLQLKHMRNFFRLDEKQWLEFELNVYHGKRIYGLHMRYWSCSSSLYLRVFPFLKVIGGSKQIVAEATLLQAPTKQSSPLSPLSNGVHRTTIWIANKDLIIFKLLALRAISPRLLLTKLNHQSGIIMPDH